MSIKVAVAIVLLNLSLLGVAVRHGWGGLNRPLLVKTKDWSILSDFSFIISCALKILVNSTVEKSLVMKFGKRILNEPSRDASL